MNNRKQSEIKKLYKSELATSVICGYLIYLLNKMSAHYLDIGILYTGILLMNILVQSAAYWYYRTKVKYIGSQQKKYILAIFNFLKKIMPFFIGLYPLLLMILLYTGYYSLSTPTAYYTLLFLLFCGIEYINNYFFKINIRDFHNRKPSDLNIELCQKGGI